MENSELYQIIEQLPKELKLNTINFIRTQLSEQEPISIKPGFGGGKGLITYMADDFDAPLKVFHEYSYKMSIEFVEKIEKLSAEQQEELELITDEMLKKQSVQ